MAFPVRLAGGSTGARRRADRGLAGKATSRLEALIDSSDDRVAVMAAQAPASVRGILLTRERELAGRAS
jgi:hypothetical protein